MVKPQSCEKTSLRKGAWSPEEDKKLVAYISRYGIWNWTQMPKPAGLLRTGKSCRLRWMNYLRPDIKRGNVSEEEEHMIMKLHQELGNRWSTIAARLPGRTDNEIKNYWHTRLSKKRLRNKPVPATSLQETETASIETNHKNQSEVDSLPPARKLSNFDGCKVSPMSFQLSTDDYSSSSSDPSCTIYEDQITEKNIGPSEAYKLHSFLGMSFPMEGLCMMEGFGTTAPGPILPTSRGSYSNRELQGLLEQESPVKDLGVVESDKAKDTGFVMPSYQGGFSTEEFQRSLEWTFPMEGLDVVKSHGATEPGVMISNPQAGYSNEELQSLLEQSFPIESLYEVEGYGAITDPEVDVSYSQWGLQEGAYSCSSNYDTGNDFWPYFLMEANDDGI